MAYIIDKHCSTCHYCYNECPVHAIRFVGVEYAIDQDKCIGCGKCEKVCPAGAITNTESPKPEPHDLRTVTCDAVVIGGGGAGLVAAVRYAELTGKRGGGAGKGQKARRKHHAGAQFYPALL